MDTSHVTMILFSLLSVNNIGSAALDDWLQESSSQNETTDGAIPL